MLNKIICFLLGHQYYIVQRFSSHARRIGCAKCKQTWSMNDNVMACLKWDEEFANLYFNVFEHIEIKPWR